MNRRELFKGFGALVVVAPVIAQLPPAPAMAAPVVIPPAPPAAPIVDPEGICRVVVRDQPLGGSGMGHGWLAKAFWQGDEVELHSITETWDYDLIDVSTCERPEFLRAPRHPRMLMGGYDRHTELELEGEVLDITHRDEVTEARVLATSWRRRLRVGRA